MEIQISLAGRGDRAARIYRHLLEAILDGRLPPGDRLPPTRELAERLAVSRNTVAAAYDRLTADGFLAARVGAGTFVADAPVGPARERRAPAGQGVRPRGYWRSPSGAASTPAPPGRYDFTVGTPDPRLFPLDTWRRLVANQLRVGAMGGGGYGDPAGHSGFREAVARYVGVARSVRARADDVLATTGAQQALDLVGRVLIEPGDCVAVEDPGYPPARALFRSLGAVVAGVPVDDEGLVVDRLPASAGLVYTTPSHQFPLGTPMSLRRRAALLDWAQRHGAVVVEDDYDSEFRFSDRPLEPLQSLDRGGRVVYVGSFSKTMLPMLRLGFLVAPESLRPALLVAKRLTDWHGDLTTQGAMAQFMAEGLLARHIRRASREYAARHEEIAARLDRDFADWLVRVPSAAGLHLAARLAPGTGVDVAAVAVAARSGGVTVESLDRYRLDADVSGLVLGYGRVDPAGIGPGLDRLAAAFRAVAD
ncbi:PLP-dependent aminotransferase family protein [Micromonospora mirobrigensis]|uniref:GntR family transcriptional regulator / MocR family aminotransferase n=1 Tax=Micromonospora mirobrigensis TaxID=262898 RepID=A0A1C4W8E7_9ACTN|nr:PLP-dependent aminotransferase family protein [Micromonospora mirobrigensis]SCE92507.1 GntR family transcriptional regulator / MocR family aminotransferase [Micromonospora mirobrigensis]